MISESQQLEPQPGDWIAVDAAHGAPPHRGEIVEILGSAGRRHFRVRWDDDHESIFFPNGGVTIFPGAAR